MKLRCEKIQDLGFSGDFVGGYFIGRRQGLQRPKVLRKNECTALSLQFPVKVRRDMAVQMQMPAFVPDTLELGEDRGSTWVCARGMIFGH